MINYCNIETDGAIDTLPVLQLKIEDHQVWCLIQYSDGDTEWEQIDIDDIFDDEETAFEATLY